MGVKNLWQIIEPYGRKISIVELQKKHVAVDLSCWICESQVLSERNKTHFRNIYLRNLFFRTAVLLSANITPVYVMDGVAPIIKSSTLSKRNQLRAFNNIPDKENKVCKSKTETQRKMLKSRLKECQSLLSFMGLECLWSCGEGEALCALLDQKEIVDGIITQDNDAFLYGARKIYKNFSLSHGFGTVDVFNMSDIAKHLNLTREKLIAMSLLCGCDYDNTGIYGIGSKKSLDYLSSFNGDVIARLKELRSDEELRLYEAEKNGCKKCLHYGTLKEHNKSGCSVCGSQSKCIKSKASSYDSLSGKEKMRVDFELTVRQEILLNPVFPDMATINEYLNFDQEITKTEFKWAEPDILGFALYMEQKCNWTQCYAFEKILPLYCRWSLLNSTYKDVVPCKILKNRVLKGIPSFDIQWKITKNRYICRDHKNCMKKLITTVEPKVLIIEQCKSMYDEFMSECSKKSKKAKKPNKNCSKKQVDVHNLTETMDQLSILDENVKSDTLKYDVNFHSNCDPTENMSISSLACDSDEGDELTGTSFSFSLNDSATVEYDLNDYQINESLIVDNIIARRQYY